MNEVRKRFEQIYRIDKTCVIYDIDNDAYTYTSSSSCESYCYQVNRLYRAFLLGASVVVETINKQTNKE